MADVRAERVGESIGTAVTICQLSVVSERYLRERGGRVAEKPILLTRQLEIDATVGVDFGRGRNIQLRKENFARPEIREHPQSIANNGVVLDLFHVTVAKHQYGLVNFLRLGWRRGARGAEVGHFVIQPVDLLLLCGQQRARTVGRRIDIGRIRLLRIRIR